MALVERTLELLQRELGGALALGDLHRELVRELGPDAGSYHQLYLALKQESRRLIVLEPATVLQPAQGDVPDRSSTGSVPATMVALSSSLPLDAPESILPFALATLQDFSAAAPERVSRSELVAAFMELEALQRTIGAEVPTTTLLRDLPERR